MQQQTLLSQGLALLGLSLNALQQQQLLDFLALLQRWNKAYNLTAVREPDAMVAQHLLDSLAVLPFLSGERVLDVGSGAGLPGIPLAIAQPERQFTLLDSNGKKTRFIQQSIMEIGLSNVQVVKNRIEQYRPPQRFDTVTSRAFAALRDFYRQIQVVCHADSRILAMKGKLPDSELYTIPQQAVVSIEKLDIPLLAAERHIVIMRVTETY